MRKPDFFIVGAAKSGTTSLYHYLNQHPSIFIPSIKEPHFFGEYFPYTGRNVNNIYEYLELFKGISSSVKAGEASTTYLYSPSAAEQIKKFQPNAKIIIILRNPVDRAYSLYWHQVRGLLESLSFEDALKIENNRTKKHELAFSFSYIKSGYYANQVRRYLDFFGNDSVKIFLFEDLKSDPRKVCEIIFNFLNVNQYVSIDINKKYNRSGPYKSILLSKFIKKPLKIKKTFKKCIPDIWWESVKKWLIEKNINQQPPMSHNTRVSLQEIFKEDILYLEKIIGRDLSNWLK